MSPDLHDWFEIVNKWNATKALLFAPRAQAGRVQPWDGQGCGTRGEDFYAPTYLRMRLKYYTKGQEAASAEQAWKYSADSIISSHGGSAKRALYRSFP